MSSPRIAIIGFSMQGHVLQMAEAEKAGIEAQGGTADIYQVPETIAIDVVHDYPTATPQMLTEYDAFLFGVPSRYGNMPPQYKAFWDATGQLWAKGSLAGKHAGLFISAAGPGGGQESTAYSVLSTLTHHGILYVPFGYASGYSNLSSQEEDHGGSPWGAGTFTGKDGSRQPSQLELKIAEAQGGAFYDIVSRVVLAKKAA